MFRIRKVHFHDRRVVCSRLRFNCCAEWKIVWLMVSSLRLWLVANNTKGVISELRRVIESITRFCNLSFVCCEKIVMNEDLLNINLLFHSTLMLGCRKIIFHFAPSFFLMIHTKQRDLISNLCNVNLNVSRPNRISHSRAAVAVEWDGP